VPIAIPQFLQGPQGQRNNRPFIPPRPPSEPAHRCDDQPLPHPFWLTTPTTKLILKSKFTPGFGLAPGRKSSAYAFIHGPRTAADPAAPTQDSPTAPTPCDLGSRSSHCAFLQPTTNPRSSNILAGATIAFLVLGPDLTCAVYLPCYARRQAYHASRGCDSVAS
jgi:hypothetical protein